MKKYLYLFFIPIVILLFILKSIQINAQELKVASLNHLKKNTSARITREKDVNGQFCALVIIKHNFKDFNINKEDRIDSGMEPEKIEQKIGEIWVWLSPDEYQLVIRKVGYIPLSVDLKDKLKENETYELKITDEYGQILVNAPNALIWLDNQAVDYNNYTFRLKEGKYIVKATRENYFIEEQFVILNAGDSIKLNFKLKPKEQTVSDIGVISEIEPDSFGILNINALEASIWIDANEISKDSVSLKLKPDKYAIKATKENYYDEEKYIILKAGDSLNINLELEPIINENTFLNTLSNYGFLGIGYGITYGSSWGARAGFVTGSKFRVGFNGGIGIYKNHVQYSAGLRFFVYKAWTITVQYGTNGFIYNTGTGEFLYLQEGISLLFGYGWYLSKHVGISWGIGGFYDTNFNNEVNFVSEAGLIFRF